MRKLAGYLKEILKNEFNAPLYLITGALLAILFYLNFSENLAYEVFGKYRGSFKALLNYFLFFGGSYFLIICLDALLKKDYSALKSKAFWGFSLFGLVLLSVDGTFYQYMWDLAEILDSEGYYRQWYFALLKSFKRIFFLGLVLYLFKAIFDKNQNSFYGLTTKNFDWKPYALIVLVVILPLVIIAAYYMPAFLKTYPLYKPGLAENYGGLPYPMTVGLFELFYGGRFVFVEVFFRGFLIIGIGRLIGPRAILPMAFIYALWHFGKPMPEAVSSFFGGYALGVFSYKTGSVLGGVILHITLALSMEAIALIVNYAL